MNKTDRESGFTNEAKAALEARSFIGSLRLNLDEPIECAPAAGCHAQTGSSMRDAYFSYELI
ncbi:hypothetical protein [Massilia glaciei]|uniref:Uncharacterized protein n=1 Tax=Massilia glaciei TaxID=1524097 RepID=A0A2U2H923_9BURK|nr:hypothetical protein [Massilia glaciei]PWF39120.1 hypothetical protein C7C56_027180 [Massilia glaciei]